MHIMFGPRASLPVTRRKLAILTLLMLLLASSEMPLAQATAKPGQALAGVWGTEQSFGPLVRGILTIDGRQAKWRASIAGFTFPVDHNGSQITFSLPDAAGEFRGSLDRASNTVYGEWIQPAGVINNSRYATPVRLVSVSASVWKGEVVPLADRISFYVCIQPQPDGSFKAAILNPEYNLFRRRSYNVAVNGSTITFTNPKRPDDHFTGTYDRQSDRLLLSLLDSYPPFALSHRNRQ